MKNCQHKKDILAAYNEDKDTVVTDYDAVSLCKDKV